MALHKVAVAAKDGATSPAAIPGGIQQHDTSGTGAGPNDPLVILVDSTGNEILGTTADAAATTSDATPISFMSVFKQISKSIQAAAASLATLVSDGATATAAEQALQLVQETAINTVLGTTAGTAVVTDAVGTVQQYLRGLVKLIAAGINVVITNANVNGQVAMAASAPVVIASDQSALTMQVAAAANLVNGAITTAMTGTTSTSLIAAPGAGLHNMLTQFTVSNAHATQGTDIVLQDGSSGTTIYTVPAAANYGGATITFNPPLRQPTVNTALFVANVTTGASTKASASGFKAA